MTPEEKLEKNRIKQARWRAKNPEKYREGRARRATADNEKRRKRYQQDPAFRLLCNLRNRLSKKKHSVSVKAYNAEYNKANADAIRAKSRRHYDAKKAMHLARMAAYHEANKANRNRKAQERHRLSPEKQRARSAKRRTLLKVAEGTHSASDIRAIFLKQDGLCLYCNVSLAPGYHVDRRMPLSKGGTNWPDNLQILCVSCDLKKKAKMPDDFEASL